MRLGSGVRLIGRRRRGGVNALRAAFARDRGAAFVRGGRAASLLPGRRALPPLFRFTTGLLFRFTAPTLFRLAALSRFGLKTRALLGLAPFARFPFEPFALLRLPARALFFLLPAAQRLGAQALPLREPRGRGGWQRLRQSVLREVLGVGWREAAEGAGGLCGAVARGVRPGRRAFGAEGRLGGGGRAGGGRRRLRARLCSARPCCRPSS